MTHDCYLFCGYSEIQKYKVTFNIKIKKPYPLGKGKKTIFVWKAFGVMWQFLIIHWVPHARLSLYFFFFQVIIVQHDEKGIISTFPIGKLKG